MDRQFKIVVLYLLILIARKVLFGEGTSLDEWLRTTKKAREIIEAKEE